MGHMLGVQAHVKCCTRVGLITLYAVPSCCHSLPRPLTAEDLDARLPCRPTHASHSQHALEALFGTSQNQVAWLTAGT